MQSPKICKQSKNLNRVIRVAVPLPLKKLFDYMVPPEVAIPPIGGRVRVQFSGRALIAICLEQDPSNPHKNPNPIIEGIDQEPALPIELIELAQWLSSYYFHPLGETLSLMLPPGARAGKKLELQHRELWFLAEGAVIPEKGSRQKDLFNLIKKKGEGIDRLEIKQSGFQPNILKALADKGLVNMEPERLDKMKPFQRNKDALIPTLTPEQSTAIQKINTQNRNGFSTTLLEGVTGSGKTEVYLRLIEQVCSEGKQALVLVPEIALTPQTLSRFKERFDGEGTVVSMHSDLSHSERTQNWLLAKNGRASIIIGTRSAVLVPFYNLGLIVVDEEHDSSFKQTEGLRYSARDVAVKRAQTLNIPLVLGSATPALETINNVDKGLYHHVQLKNRVAQSKLPSYNIVDIRGRILQGGISNELIQTLRKHIEKGNQALVFLNRRGFATTYLCISCGWIKTCSSCDMRMTLHQKPELLICHQCGKNASINSACEQCGASEMKPVGVGTQRAEEMLERYFPDVPLIRIDRDNIKNHVTMQKELARINTGKPAILIGTQMIAKGHHFPKVTLVGIVNADSGFLSSDFRAPERTAQIITQVAGRAGRGDLLGEVVIQTFQPGNGSLRSLIEKGYDGFARMELQTRRDGSLPPYHAMALIRAESKEENDAKNFLLQLANGLKGATEVLGPVAAPIMRIANRYRYQLMLIAPTRTTLHKCLNFADQSVNQILKNKSQTRRKKTKITIKWSIDVDPYDTF